MVKKYVPDRGDIVWIDFNPQKGREQKGLRPALVLSPKVYNEKSSLALFCPVTTQLKGYLFEVSFAGNKVRGAVLANQMRTLDWRERPVSFIEKAEVQAVAEVQQKAVLLITGT